MIPSIILLFTYCAKHTPVDIGDDYPTTLEFSIPLPADDTVMVDGVYTGSIGGGDVEGDSSELFFIGAPQGYTYDPAADAFVWKADKNNFDAESGPFTIKAGLTNSRDTIYHEWTLYVKEHEWEFMSQDDELRGIAAYDSGLLFKLNERRDSVVGDVGYVSGYIQRSFDGGRSWENYRILSLVLQRIFKLNMWVVEGLEDIRVFNNTVYFVFYNAFGTIGFPLEAWNLYSVDIDAGPLTEPDAHFPIASNDTYDYFVSPLSDKVYQLSSSVDQTNTFALAKIIGGDVQELSLSQTSGKCIVGTNQSENVLASFFFKGIYRKLGENGTWENIGGAEFRKMEAAGDTGDTLYLLDTARTLYSATQVMSTTQLFAEKISAVEKVIDIKMYTGKTGWVLTSQGEVYFTNNMFQTVTCENITRDGTAVTITAITKAFKDRHLFAVSENSEIFRY